MSGSFPSRLWWPFLRRAAYRTHQVAGLIAGAFLLLLGLSGSVLVFGEELDRAAAPELYDVRPAQPRLSPSRLIALAEAHAGAPVSALRFPSRPDAPVEAWLAGEGARTAFLDPYRGVVLGVREADAGAVGFLRALHLRMFAGETGHAVVGACGVALITLCVSGVALWWPGRRKLALGFTLRRPFGWQRTAYDLHRLVGFLSLVLLLLTGLTGTALVFPRPFEVVLDSVLGGAPAQAVIQAGPAGRIPLDELVRGAEAALPGATTTRIDLPVRPGAALRVRSRHPDEAHPNGMSFVHVDPATGHVLRVDDARAQRLTSRILALRYPIHIGTIGGWNTRVLACLTGFAPAVLFLTGLFLFLRRARARLAHDQRSAQPETTP